MKSINHLEMQNYISEKISIDSFAAKLGKDEIMTAMGNFDFDISYKL